MSCFFVLFGFGVSFFQLFMQTIHSENNVHYMWEGCEEVPVYIYKRIGSENLYIFLLLHDKPEDKHYTKKNYDWLAHFSCYKDREEKKTIYLKVIYDSRKALTTKGCFSCSRSICENQLWFLSLFWSRVSFFV